MYLESLSLSKHSVWLGPPAHAPNYLQYIAQCKMSVAEVWHKQGIIQGHQSSGIYEVFTFIDDPNSQWQPWKNHINMVSNWVFGLAL